MGVLWPRNPPFPILTPVGGGRFRKPRVGKYRSRRNYYSINSQELHGCNAAHYSLVINSQELQDCNCNCNLNCNPN